MDEVESPPGWGAALYGINIAPIEIFDNTFIGCGSIILPGMKIGPNAVVAAGAVVAKDVPEGAVVGGNPAKPIGDFDVLKEKRNLCNRKNKKT